MSIIIFQRMSVLFTLGSETSFTILGESKFIVLGWPKSSCGFKANTEDTFFIIFTKNFIEQHIHQLQHIHQYAYETTLMTESEEELKSLLRRVKRK